MFRKWTILNKNVFHFYYFLLRIKYMADNIFESKRVSDIIYILKKNPNKFVVIGLTMLNNDTNIIKYIRSYLKNQSKQYSNVIFIYYMLKDDDFGKKFNLINADKELYPIIYHIFNVTQIIISVTNADPDSISESFRVMDQYYENKPIEAKLNADCYDISNQKNDGADSKKRKEITKNRIIQQKNQKKKLDKLVEISEKFNNDFLKDIYERKLIEEKKLIN